MGKWPDQPSLLVWSIVLTVAFVFALHATTGTAAPRDAKEETMTALG